MQVKIVVKSGGVKVRKYHNIKINMEYDIFTIPSIYTHLFLCVGCGRLWSIDGNWKIRYPVCMYPHQRTQQHFKAT